MGLQQQLDHQEATFYGAVTAILLNLSGSSELLEPLISALPSLAHSYKKALLAAAGEQPGEDRERKQGYARQASDIGGNAAFLTLMLRKTLMRQKATQGLDHGG